MHIGCYGGDSCACLNVPNTVQDQISTNVEKKYADAVSNEVPEENYVYKKRMTMNHLK